MTRTVRRVASRSSRSGGGSRQTFRSIAGGGWPFWSFVAFLGACFLLGGASRGDVPQLLLLRPLAIIYAGVILIFARRYHWVGVLIPGIFLAALAGLVLLWLLPMPPGLWQALPGRSQATAAVTLIGRGREWHAVTLSPDGSLNTLFSMVVPAAALLGLAAIRPEERSRLVVWLMLLVLTNMLVCYTQLLAGASGALRLYRITNVDGAVGLFANRNHGATLVGASIAMFAALAADSLRRATGGAGLLAVMGALIGLALFTLLAIGSRSGLVAGVVGLVWAIVILWRPLRRLLPTLSRPYRIAALALPALVLAGLVSAAMLGARDETLRRLGDPALYDDARVQSLPTTVRMIWTYFPFGSGFGTFDGVYRAVEPESLLSLEYLNHAHNDYVEILIEGGAAAAAILAMFAVWSLGQAVGAVRALRTGASLPAAMAGVLMIGAVSSFSDYPLRTPIWMVVFSMAAVLVSPTATSAKNVGARSPARASGAGDRGVAAAASKASS